MRCSPLLAVCGVALATLSGCASYVTTNVTAFQDWHGSDRDLSYAFARSPAQQNDLEQQAYEQMVGEMLSTYGFKLTPQGQAHYAISLAYGQRDSTAYAPQAIYPGDAYGPWGGWGMPRRGWGPGWGPGWYAPPQIVEMPYAAYASQLTIRMTDRVSGHEVYKVTANHVGGQVPLPVVMPYLVNSALAHFPMSDGTRVIRINVDKRGRPIGAPNEVSVSATASPALLPSTGAAAVSPAASSPAASPAK